MCVSLYPNFRSIFKTCNFVNVIYYVQRYLWLFPAIRKGAKGNKGRHANLSQHLFQDRGVTGINCLDEFGLHITDSRVAGECVHATSDTGDSSTYLLSRRCPVCGQRPLISSITRHLEIKPNYSYFYAFY